MFKWFRDRKRKKEILKDCGCVCYCPKCKEMLNDRSECKEKDSSGIYEYTCSNCNYKAVFHFGIAPAPILIDGANGF